MTATIFSFLLASVLLTLSPGPDIIYVLTQSITRGKKAGILTATGLVSGILIHTSLVAFGVAYVISKSPVAFETIKIVGALYLFYLAYKTWTASKELDFEGKEPAESRRNLYFVGLFMNLINPKVILFFLAFLPGFLWNQQGNITYQFYVLGVIFMLQAWVIFTGVSVLAAKISNFLRRGKTVQRKFKYLQVLIYLGIGVFILWG